MPRLIETGVRLDARVGRWSYAEMWNAVGALNPYGGLLPPVEHSRQGCQENRRPGMAALQVLGKR